MVDSDNGIKFKINNKVMLWSSVACSSCIVSIYCVPMQTLQPESDYLNNPKASSGQLLTASSKSDSNRTAMIAALAVAFVVLVSLIVVAAFLLRRSRHRNRDQSPKSAQIKEQPAAQPRSLKVKSGADTMHASSNNLYDSDLTGSNAGASRLCFKLCIISRIRSCKIDLEILNLSYVRIPDLYKSLCPHALEYSLLWLVFTCFPHSFAEI